MNNIKPINLELNFHNHETQFPTTDEFKLIIPKIGEKYQIYYYISNIIYPNNIEYISITYRIYYSHNCSYGLFHGIFPRNAKLCGYHDIDLEHIRILLNKKTHKPEFVYFSAHDCESKWIPWNDCLKNENDDLKVFVAYCSHANYPYPGTWCRVMFIGNDKTSNTGRKIIPELNYKPFKLNITYDDIKFNSLRKRLQAYIILDTKKNK